MDISEVWDRATESDEGAGRLEKKRNLPLPPPAARQTLPEIRIPPKANKKLGSAAADDQIEVDLTRQTAISEYSAIHLRRQFQSEKSKVNRCASCLLAHSQKFSLSTNGWLTLQYFIYLIGHSSNNAVPDVKNGIRTRIIISD